MAGLPGWDRDRLAMAPGADVEAARWQIFARVVEPQVTADYESAIRSLAIASMSPTARAREERAQLTRDKAALRAGQRKQAALRKLLLLDDEDEPDEDEDEA